MTELIQLLVTIIIVLAAAYLPGYAAARALGGSRLLALGLAPALGAAIAGMSAVIAPLVGLRWSLLPFLLGSAIAIALAYGLRRLGVRLPGTVLDGPLSSRRIIPGGAAWLTGALAVAIVPIAVQAGRPDAVLERWDTLYHLSALQRIRETGTASSLAVGSVSNSTGDPTAYPAGFHALASLVPGVEIPNMLNGAVLALAVLPWVLGTALLSRALFPQVAWAPFASAMVAALIPATPVDLAIHLSPIPNLSGFAALPGALAAAAALWGALLPRLTEPEGPRTPPLWKAAMAATAAVGLAGLGLGLLHPNVAVTALLLLAVLTAVTGARCWRNHPGLLVLPVAALLPVALLTYTPMGAKVTGFSGGLQIPWWTALGEILLGLLTVWPMALGVVIAVLWWPGLVTSFRSSSRWVGVAWVVIAAIYLDAALDSPLNLSILYYRGQDRLSMPLAMLSAVLIVPGLQWWSRKLRTRTIGAPRPALARPLVSALVVVAAVVTLASVPARSDNAAKNLAAEYPGRGRFLQADERAMFEQHVPLLDPDATVLASPFSGAAHLYALYGQDVHFTVAGMSGRDLDTQLLTAATLAATSPEHCQLLQGAGIGYIYTELTPYNNSPEFAVLNEVGSEIGDVVFETSHSRLLAVDCDADV
ncbi:DUF6541 family protein [uncultured Brachybacterium sp.]|uniref:DUF6541 family protein n=1 Tax=uncultured Brachybacterium sp. TaxID=189680 RepID=UPI0026017D89|nr:DUF6541 family protein [uncultured Brachybacterium sp.]